MPPATATSRCGPSHASRRPAASFQIIVTEIPYQLNKTNLLERIAELAHEGRLDQISDLRDESDRTGMRIVIELKRNAVPKKTLNRLFKYTPLQSTFAINMLALINGEPRLLSLKRALYIFIEHRQVITRRSLFELESSPAPIFWKGCASPCSSWTRSSKRSTKSESAEAAHGALMERFGFSEAQAQAILDLQLRRLAALEQQKIEDEYSQVKARMEWLEDLLANPEKILAIIREETVALKERFNDERRSVISHEVVGEMREEDLTPNDPVLITITQNSYVKRTGATQFHAQGRGGRGVLGMATHDEDEIAHLHFAHAHDHVLFFTNHGRVYSDRVWNLPRRPAPAKGCRWSTSSTWRRGRR